MAAPSTLAAIKKGLGFTMLPKPSQYDTEWWNGRLAMWEEPRQGFSYSLGVDVAKGVGKDRSVIEVIRIGTREFPDEQVAEFASDFHDTTQFAAIINAVGRLYCDDTNMEALATIECNGPGVDVQSDLRLIHGYSNIFVWKVYDKRLNIYTNKLGWWTNRSTRPRLIARGIHALTQRDLILHSEELFDELEDFQRDANMADAAAMGLRGGERHDDRVMAILIAYVGAHDEEWIAGMDVAGERRRLQIAGKYEEAVERRSGVKPDFATTDCTYDAMMDAADNALFEDS